MSRKIYFWGSAFFFFFIFFSSLIAEEKSSLLSLPCEKEHQKLLVYKKQYRLLLQKIRESHEKQMGEEEIGVIIDQARELKGKIENTEKRKGREEGETGSLWQQTGISIEDLVIQYGSQEDVYMIPEDIGAIKIFLSSQLSIPESSWPDLLESILAQNGVAIRALNPYLKQLYWISNDLPSIQLITDRREELELFPLHTRICFALKPAHSHWQEVMDVLEKFADPREVSTKISGQFLFLISRVDILRDLLHLLDFLGLKEDKEEYRILFLKKLPAKEMVPILEKICMGSILKNGWEKAEVENENHREESELFHAKRGGFSFPLQLVLFPSQPHVLVLLGKREVIEKALQIVSQIEEEVQESRNRIIHYYSCKNSDPEELAIILSQVYPLLSPLTGKEETKHEGVGEEKREAGEDFRSKKEKIIPSAPSQERGNFIVDKKSGGILLVVEKEYLFQIKELLARLDVAKKMIHIEILLFEKKMEKGNSFGLHLLRLGKESLPIGGGGSWRELSKGLYGKNGGSVSSSSTPSSRGVFQFFFSSKQKQGFPAYNAAYQFILNQEDVQVNSNPSITTTNKVPAKISIVEERSIKMAETLNSHNDRSRQSFERKEFGIHISIVPSIHIDSDGESQPLITLQTDIEFDDTDLPMGNMQPEVTKRKVRNEVCIADGKSVIIGGLRRKKSSNVQETIPFLGEIPGLGKIFNYRSHQEETKEMFIFITPKILHESGEGEEWEKLHQRELSKRPGDLPSILDRLQNARQQKENYFFRDSLRALFHE